MADQLRVNPAVIRDASTAVDRIRRGLDNTASLTDSFHDAIGQQRLSDALHTFATNWRVHREHMTQDLQTFSKWADQVAATYEEADRKLAQALKQKAGKK